MHLLRLALATSIACAPTDATVGGQGAKPGGITDGADAADGTDAADASDTADASDSSDATDGAADPTEGTIRFTYGDWSRDPDDLECDLIWEVQTTLVSADCPDCTFAVATEGTLTGDSFGERACDWTWASATMTFGIYEDARGGEPEVSVLIDYYGSEYWYPVYYSRFTGDSIRLSYGEIAYEYRYEGRDYYYSYYFAVEAEVPDR